MLLCVEGQLQFSQNKKSLILRDKFLSGVFCVVISILLGSSSALATERMSPRASDSPVTKRVDRLLGRCPQNENDPVRTALSRGMAWSAHFFEDRFTLIVIFSDELQMAAELSQSRVACLSKAAVFLGSRLVKRAVTRLPLIFRKDGNSRSDFISVIPLLPRFTRHFMPFVSYYHDTYTDVPDEKLWQSYRSALSQRDADHLLDALIDYSYLHRAHDSPLAKDLSLPPDRWSEVLADLEEMPLSRGLDSNADVNSDRGYLITHVVLTLTDYGEKPFAAGERLRAALSRSIFDLERIEIAKKSPDIDLLAEFGQSLILLGFEGHPEVARLRDVLLAAQNTDGSWGTHFDPDQPYDALHPTWTVMTFLNALARP